MARVSAAAETDLLQTGVPTLVPPRGEQYIAGLIGELGEDPSRAGLRDTPRRVLESLYFLTSGYDHDVREVVGDALFEESYDEMVVVRDIEFFSLCEHHLLPFFGRAHLSYIPDGRVLGLSKLSRLVDLFSHRLQIQERLTTQVAEALEEALHPKGVAVVMEASHLCMMMRGVEKQGAQTVTSATRGVFHTDPRSRNEFLDLLKG